MHRPHQMPNCDTPVLIQGDVTVHDGAAIAPGVLLQADPGSSITVASGVCIGMGSILHAQGGRLEVGTGVTLGYGVLLIGVGRVDAGACVGSLSTVINPMIGANQIIPPKTLTGGEDGVESSNGATPETIAQPSSTERSPTEDSPATASASSEPPPNRVVYGRASFERMMVSMFPHRQSLNTLTDTDVPPGEGANE